MATNRSEAIITSILLSSPANVWTKQICNCVTDGFALGLDVHQHLRYGVEVKQMPTKGRLERKKYAGVWRRGSQMTARMMSRLPSTVTKYMDRNRQKRMGCNSGSPDSPRGRNSEVMERFLGCILSVELIERWRQENKTSEKLH